MSFIWMNNHFIQPEKESLGKFPRILFWPGAGLDDPVSLG
jgi:hypothetical protein